VLLSASPTTDFSANSRVLPVGEFPAPGGPVNFPGMEDAEVSNRLTALELAVAHLTEAVEELAGSLDGATTPSITRIRSHLRDVRANFNQVAPRPGGG
jgi:uncharacterized coiled-coil protein SlyX